MKRIPTSNGQIPGHYIKATAFSTVSFFDKKQDRQIIILYTLGEDGIVREFCNNKWTGFPIYKDEPVPTP
jgi:hypothetical protein